MKNTFDESTHQYRIGGQIVHSVTQVLKHAGHVDETWYTPAHADRGTYVHLACTYYDQGILDWSSLDPQLKGYVDAWVKFRRAMPVNFEIIEEPFWNEQYGFAGTIDRAWKQGSDTIICDIKTGQFPEWLSLQLGGYSILYPAMFGCGVRLTSDGKFSMKNIGCYELALARKKFLYALNEVKNGTMR